MQNLKYTRTHEWLRIEAGQIATLGITDHAQQLLGDLVFVELPETGTDCQAGKELAVLESVKAAADLYAPVSGKVIEINSKVKANPGLINQDPQGEGWLIKISMQDVQEVNQLLTEEQYQQEIEGESA